MTKKKDRRKEGKEGKEDESGIFLVRPICLISHNPVLSYPIDYRHKNLIDIHKRTIGNTRTELRYFMTFITKHDLWSKMIILKHFSLITLQHLSLWHHLRKIVCGLIRSPCSICPDEILWKRWFWWSYMVTLQHLYLWHSLQKMICGLTYDDSAASVLMTFYTKDNLGSNMFTLQHLSLWKFIPKFIIYLSKILCLSYSCHIPVCRSCGTLSYSLCFSNQIDQGDETEGFEREEYRWRD